MRLVFEEGKKDNDVNFSDADVVYIVSVQAIIIFRVDTVTF